MADHRDPSGPNASGGATPPTPPPPGDQDGVPLDPGDGRTVTVSRLPRGVGDVTAVEVLRHNATNAATVGIWRVRGTRGSAVLKMATPPTAGSGGYWPTSDEPTHWNYWRREWLAYTTGLTDTAYGAAGVTGPEVLEAAERADGRVELWLADVEGAEGFAWSPARLARFAHELGAGQARFVGRVPAHGWLSRDWLGQYLAEGPARSVDVADADWEHPGVAAWPAPVRDGLRRLWAGRDRLLAAARAGERTLCHLDVWPANLIDHRGRSVLLDWSFTGVGAVGEDVSNLVLDSFTDGLMDVDLLPEVAETVVDGYLAGLRDGGWSGSDDRVRTAVAACGAAKYSWLAPAWVGRAVAGAVGPSAYGTDDSADAAARRMTGLVTLITDWSRRATS